MSWLSVMWAAIQLALWVFQKLKENQLISQGHQEALKNLLDEANALVNQIDSERKSALSGVDISDEFNRDHATIPGAQKDNLPVILPGVVQPHEGLPGNSSSVQAEQPDLDKPRV